MAEPSLDSFDEVQVHDLLPIDPKEIVGR